MLLLTPCVAAAAQPLAPAASPESAAACGRAVEASRATADDVIDVSGTVRLGGCVTDTSGIEHLTLSWSDAAGRHGRICTDPAIVDDRWSCPWNTARIPAGRYDVLMAAVDLAGNRGEFDRHYEVAAPEVERRDVAPPVATDPLPQPDGPAPAPEPTPTLTPTPAPTAAPTAAPVPSAAPVEASPDDAEPAVEFSPVQRLVLDRIVACERGDGRTDDDGVVTVRDQVVAVAECLEPALLLAGLVPSEVPADVALVEPVTYRFEVETLEQLGELRAVLPSSVAGIAVDATLAPAPVT
ncbi:MAG: hypothetical protein JWO69_212 [Thermoleophilia bacterium]|nr:hypothetical protein [Thermoleophilia bacterium]